MKLILDAKRKLKEEITPKRESQILIFMAMPATKVLYAFLIFLLHHEKAVENPVFWFGLTLGAGVVFLCTAVFQGRINADGVKKMSQEKEEYGISRYLVGISV